MVSAQGEYVGGAIAPGIEISLEALGRRGAQLRKVELVRPRTVIGKNTVEALQSGMVYGFAGQVDGMVARMIAELGDDPDDVTVIATGELAPLVHRRVPRVHRARAVADAARPAAGLRAQYLNCFVRTFLTSIFALWHEFFATLHSMQFPERQMRKGIPWRKRSTSSSSTTSTAPKPIETVTFGLDGTYVRDRPERQERRRAARGARAATSATPARHGRSPRRSQAQRPPRPSAPAPAEVRDWARSNGFKVPDRGRVPPRSAAAYEAAN